MFGLYSPPTRTISLVSAEKYDRDKAVPVPWLWEPYLAFGAVSILDGDPGVAKSLFAIDIGARLSFHLPMPDGSPPAKNPTGSPLVRTVFVNAEDNVRQVQIPRFLAAGGEAKYAYFLGGIGEGEGECSPLRLPQDMGYLVNLLSNKNLNGSFVVFDPFAALFPRLAASDFAVRAAIDPLVRLAADSRCCILLVRHLNKLGGRRSLYRGGGNISIIGACRTGLLIGEHPDDPDRRVLSMTKSNLGPIAPSLSFRVVSMPARSGPALFFPGDKHPETDEEIEKLTAIDRPIPAAPVIAWDGPTTITADDLVSAKREIGVQSARAEEWLKALLEKGPVPATVVEAKAQAEGLGYRTIQHAKSRLKVESHRVVADGVAHWQWVLPAQQEME